ncbi:probable leucine-rich repeat receptor-like protein kinase At1g68400 [Argentina anserina]|uniref:probable leucine-rich repeat receptor-like protein kinase At1g68400 n=1 Tax=Argentina anserina TaxID=57926 RepID=UPI0021768AB2|nr:probable leucine-rich repeat receptor-like protein kinase At1g68400 [Potentilla anserina]
MMASSKNKYILVAMTTTIIFLIDPILISSFSTSEAFDEFYPEEREALIKLRDSVSSNSSDLHSNWTGPPCSYINSSTWSGISCSNWHVVHLVLEETQLAATISPDGPLPPTFLQNLTLLSKLSFRNNTFSGPLPNLSNLVNLEFVDFSYNCFWGSIPFEYATDLPKLEVLELQENSLDGTIPSFDQFTLRAFNVSHNHLEGPIPNTSVLQKFPKSSYDHNANLCGSPLGISCSPSPSPHSRHKNSENDRLPLSLIVAAAAVVPFLVIFAFLCYYKKVHGKDQTTSTDQDEHTEWVVAQNKVRDDDHLDERLGDFEKRVQLEFFDKDLPAEAFFDLDDLLGASAEVLGRGKLGTSYKVTLESGPVVVVKRLRSMNELSKKEFVQQMQLLGQMRHENLLEILSFYYTKEEKLLIYKFVPGAATLFELLHGNRGVGREPLTWATRLSIIKGIVHGLIFLHQSLRSHKVPHANLKSSNVLVALDGNYNVKLANFGFLPLLPARECSQNGILAIGKSPELAQAKKLSQKADVYCFGIVLLEVITGKIPGEVSPGSDERLDDLSDWVRMVVNNDWSTDILDIEMLAVKDDHNDMLKLTNIALECTDISPENRPKMIQVLKSIQEIESSSR